MKMHTAAALALFLGLFFVNFTGQCYGALEYGFYNRKCGFLNVESMVSRLVAANFNQDKTTAAALLRLQFHDCFVNGCDASILLDGSSSEKTAPPNLSVRGYDIIDAIKTTLEFICPGVVSCADIIVMATRDAVSLSQGGRYEVQTGRRDGLVSLASNVNLPSPDFTVSQSINAFSQKNLSPTDMVYLLGGHTIGIAHCAFFQNRLYNFNNTGKPDPTMPASLLAALMNTCPQNSASSGFANLDQNPASANIFDKSYYNQILSRRGVLEIDQELAQDPQTRGIVMAIASGNSFLTNFGNAMVKLGALEVLTGTQGEIRRSCRSVNS
ncbi:peroxidase 60-like [Tripterygium wilfordii]|uniref:Peroxidase n=1 Tax=Tripterygium wilfordii TaxID=458696 RepID=A0A7J7DEU5_TRIWF|nr:peroxidase 60 [Tripterygium wilfordii]XP_038706173.1 peroxidase 60 [Tripterygium wilfordii]KAF5744880.1 peroxidase 60-like [Tripterygium wilfordii]